MGKNFLERQPKNTPKFSSDSADPRRLPEGKTERKRQWDSLREFCEARGFRQEPEEWIPPQVGDEGKIYNYHETEGRLLPEAIGKDWIGVELEVVPLAGRYDLAEQICTVGNGKLFLSEDGSLSSPRDRNFQPILRSDEPYYKGNDGNWHPKFADKGFEIVTDYGDLNQVIHICGTVAEAIEGKAVSQDTDCCGLHVHLSRNEAAPLALGRLVIFWNSKKNEAFIKLFTRRDFNNYSSNKDVEGKNPSDLDMSWSDTRYELVNLTNTHTVELRGFRGTTDKDVLLACIEFASATWSFARDKDIDDTEMTWQRFIRWLAEQPASKTHYIWQYLMKKKPGIVPESIRLAVLE